MTLTLVITNVASLDNGVSTTLILERNGAVIGRSPTADWSLPDPNSYVSSTHCEIDYRDGGYTLTDRSLNGTLVNGGPERLDAPHRIADGDVITIGHYQIACSLNGGAALGAPAAPVAQPPGGEAWTGWEGPAAPAGPDDWGGPPSQNAAPQPGASVWDAPPEAVEQASGWSSPVATPGPGQGAPRNIWDQLEASNVVDWARGGFGAERRPAPSFDFQNPVAAPAAAPALGKDPFGLGASPAVPPPATPGWAPVPAPGSSRPPAPAPASRPRPAPEAPRAGRAPSVEADDAWNAFVAACGIGPADVRSQPRDALARAGGLLRHLVAGMVILLEARARAKAQLGAQGTSLELEGNNPLKFARSPERAVAQLLNPPDQGFMAADRAIEDAFRDLQAHQMATLAAMQGALAATLERFSPDSIRARAETNGILAKILPGARDAELWRAYEHEFEGVSRGSDEAFMDVFAHEFKVAYERAAAEMKSRV